MRRRQPRSTRTDTLFPYTTLFRSSTEPIRVVARGERGHTAVVSGDSERQDIAMGILRSHGRRLLAVLAAVAATSAVLAPAPAEAEDLPVPYTFLTSATLGGHSDESPVGKECVSTFRSRWAP